MLFLAVFMPFVLRIYKIAILRLQLIGVFFRHDNDAAIEVF